MIEIVIFFEVVIVVGGYLLLIHINKRVGSYASEVGKIKALSEKIDDIIDQQKQITKATEETKSEISHLAWNKKEAQTVKRHKLEEYLKELFEVVGLMRKGAGITYDTKKVEIEPLPVTAIPKLTTIQMLYLPELDGENKNFTGLINEYESIFARYATKEISFEEFDIKMRNNFSTLGSATKDISYKSQEIIKALLFQSNG